MTELPAARSPPRHAEMPVCARPMCPDTVLRTRAIQPRCPPLDGHHREPSEDGVPHTAHGNNEQKSWRHPARSSLRRPPGPTRRGARVGDEAPSVPQSGIWPRCLRVTKASAASSMGWAATCARSSTRRHDGRECSNAIKAACDLGWRPRNVPGSPVDLRAWSRTGLPATVRLSRSRRGLAPYGGSDRDSSEPPRRGTFTAGNRFRMAACIPPSSAGGGKA